MWTQMPFYQCVSNKKKTSNELNVHYIWGVESSHGNPLHICQFSDVLAPFIQLFCWDVCILYVKNMYLPVHYSKFIWPHYILLWLCLMESIQWVSKVFNLQRGLLSQPNTVFFSCYLPRYYVLFMLLTQDMSMYI